MKVLVTVGGSVGLVFALVLGLAAIAGGTAPAAHAAASTGPLCVTTGPVAGLSNVAAANARFVVAAAEPLAGHEGAVAAVMVADTESGLRILGNPTVDTGSASTQGSGSDHDSIGLFQQRASWGTVAQRLDPIASTRLFITHLLRDRGWQSKQPWIAAQDVQDSAFDGHPKPANHGSNVYGGNYQANLVLARRVVTRIEDDAAHAACGTETGGLPASTTPGSHGLPSDYSVPGTADPIEAKVVAFALAQLDKPYVFGAAGPDSFDCSGLTMAAWAQAGVQLPHYAASQATAGTATNRAALVPGDLVFVAGDDGTLAAPAHVGIYLGENLVLNAADPHDGIRVQTFDNFVTAGHGLAALRHIA